jgi:hypothetical protein
LVFLPFSSLPLISHYSFPSSSINQYLSGLTYPYLYSFQDSGLEMC